MKFIFFLSFAFVFTILPLASQEVTKFNLEQVATIEVSTAMELQNKAYRQKAQSYYNKHNLVLAPGRAVFQQVGVNELQKEALALYARIIHETKRGDYGDFPQVGVDPEISAQDLADINEDIKDQMMAPQPMDVKVTKWIGTDIVKLNGQYALHIAYVRRMDTKPLVRVDRYSFFNNNRLQNLTLSYRLSEAERWKPVLAYALDSYRVSR
jgi:hypothetical protein